MRPGMRLGSRGAHGCSATASLRSPPPPAPHRPRTQTPLETRLPAPPPPGLYSFPAPTPLPGRRATAGQPRPPGLGPRPSSRRPGASPGDSPSELASSCLRPPTYLPRIGGWGRRGPVLLPLLGGRAGGPGGDSAGLSAAGAGAHRTGPVGAVARGCALAPGGEAAEGETGGIRSLLGNSCTDSGGWAGARGGGRRGGSCREGARGGEREGADAGRRRVRAHARARAHALSRTPSTPLLRSSLLGFPLPPALRARRETRSRPPGACSARDPNLGRVHAFPAEPLPWPSADLVPCRGDWPGLAWAGWAPPPRCPSQGTMGALSPQPARANFMFNLRLIRLSPWKRAA